MKKVVIFILKASGAAFLFFSIALILSTIYFQQEWRQIKGQVLNERNEFANSLGYTEKDLKECNGYRGAYFHCHQWNSMVYTDIALRKSQNEEVKKGIERQQVSIQRWYKAVKVAEILKLTPDSYNDIFDNIQDYRIKVLAAPTWLKDPTAQVPYRANAATFGYSCAASLISTIILLLWRKRLNSFKRIIYFILFVISSFVICKMQQSGLLNTILLNILFGLMYVALTKANWEKNTLQYIYNKIVKPLSQKTRYIFAGKYINNLGISRICTVLGIIALCYYIYNFDDIYHEIDEAAIFFTPFVYFIPFIVYLMGRKLYFWIKDGFAQSSNES